MGTTKRKMFKLHNLRHITAKLRVARDDAGMTSTEVGNLVGLSQSQISRIESGIQEFFGEDVKNRVLQWASLLKVEGLEFSEGYWDTHAEVAREARHPSREEGTTLSPIQQIMALTEIAKLGAISEAVALDGIRRICGEHL
jgi:transcriptional regulator with XRE-family HTH domain